MPIVSVGAIVRARLIAAGAVGAAMALACNGLPGSVEESASGVPAQTCSQLAQRYSSLVEDASLCTVGDDTTCSGRVPIWGIGLDANGDVVEYGISECPFPGSGIAVNPARTAQLDAVLASYRRQGCDLRPGPGCGAPGQETLVGVCVVGNDGVGRCQKVSTTK